MAKKTQNTPKTPNDEVVKMTTEEKGGFTETGNADAQALDTQLEDQTFVILSPLLNKGKVLKTGTETTLELDEAELATLIDKKIIKIVEV